MPYTVRNSVLKNGLRVIESRKDTESVSIQVTVGVGSNDESDRTRGISHFIEHMLFEGTKNRDAQAIVSEIEGIGGEIGAFTGNDRTCFYVNCLRRHAKKGVEVLGDIIMNPLFSQRSLEKERGVVLSEIRMREDEPRMYQWQLFLKNLYDRHPARHPIIGYEDVLKSLIQADLCKFHSRFYVPANMIITIVGDGDASGTVKDIFGSMHASQPIKRQKPIEPLLKKTRSVSIKRKVSQSYMIVGQRTVPRSHPDSYALDVARAIIGKGMSGRIFNEIRTKRGLAYDVGVHHECQADYGFFSYYISTQKKHLRLCRDIYLREIKKLDTFDQQEFDEAKNFIEGEFVMDLEDNHDLADSLAEWAMESSVDDMFAYVKRIRKITKEDVIRVRDLYLAGPDVTTKIVQG